MGLLSDVAVGRCDTSGLCALCVDEGVFGFCSRGWVACALSPPIFKRELSRIWNDAHAESLLCWSGGCKTSTRFRLEPAKVRRP